VRDESSHRRKRRQPKKRIYRFEISDFRIRRRTGRCRLADAEIGTQIWDGNFTGGSRGSGGRAVLHKLTRIFLTADKRLRIEQKATKLFHRILAAFVYFRSIYRCDAHGYACAQALARQGDVRALPLRRSIIFAWRQVRRRCFRGCSAGLLFWDLIPAAGTSARRKWFGRILASRRRWRWRGRRLEISPLL
jgi:hypothetical protein